MTRRIDRQAQGPEPAPHRHRTVVAHALRQQSGIPYEVEQKVCCDCRTVLDERTVRRAAA
jgi:hypothetical protein